MAKILRVLSVGIVLLTGCSSAGTSTSPPEPAVFPTTTGGPDWDTASYRFTLDSRCGERALVGRYAVVVDHGAVASVEPLESTEVADSPGSPTLGPNDLPTIGELVTRAQTTDRDDLTEFHLDSATGIPREIAFDPEPTALDDEECYSISDYEPLE
ncbi:DUF6174 domain-containing protein [Cellulomonas rhizosphaerae]|uniref:Lipoprotein n=1 Tax=Cellulomonas rhizosphaerae TaxID=2293719 RepID=A0A413RN67_9CELL|nr:DUF6174 domain-containing protein [Cellulomonas rhizosphaerae]RHA42701.1 hypothetical protein D1825_06870 [Cellulomonas rhizosphaerae]